MTRISAFILTLLAASLGAQNTPETGGSPLRAGEDQREALKINDAIYQAVGFGNTFLVTTPAGNVIIDTSSPRPAQRHLKLLKAISQAPVKYIILTHGHGDHTGGVPLWKEPGTQIVAQREHVEFVQYQRRLAGFFGHRNAAQFDTPVPEVRNRAGIPAEIAPTILFDESYKFSLGGVDFEIYHTPGETPDHLTVWIPKYKAAFVGDNYYTSFPNMYTLRGTKPRWALDYIASLNKVLALEPEIVLPSHGRAITGHAEAKRKLTQYRDAIEYVHDAVVKGMNDGRDVYTLMREIRLPKELEVGESYGKLTWSIRGIYEGYAGWFDLRPESLYELPDSAVYADVVRLAGGPDALTKLALDRLAAGRTVEALHLTGMALEADPKNGPARAARLQILDSLRKESRNSNERGWLDYAIGQVK